MFRVRVGRNRLPITRRPKAAATSPCVSTYCTVPQTSNQPAGHRSPTTQAAYPLHVLACIHAYFACFKNKMDTNPFAAVAYLPDSNLTLLAVETRKILRALRRASCHSPAASRLLVNLRLGLLLHGYTVPMKIQSPMESFTFPHPSQLLTVNPVVEPTQ